MVMLLAFAASTFNKTFFLHAHKQRNGEVVFHAHPYQKNSDSTPFKKHHHSHDEYVSIDHGDLLFFSVQNHSKIIVFSSFIKWITPQEDVKAESHFDLNGRAPPTFITC